MYNIWRGGTKSTRHSCVPDSFLDSTSEARCASETWRGSTAATAARARAGACPHAHPCRVQARRTASGYRTEVLTRPALLGRGLNDITGKPGYTTERMCGVGITFVEDHNGALYVKSLVPGGSSARSGSVQVLQSPPMEREGKRGNPHRSTLAAAKVTVCV